MMKIHHTSHFQKTRQLFLLFVGNIPVLSFQGHKAMIDFRQDTRLSIQ